MMPIPYIPPKTEYRHCDECRTMFGVNRLSNRRLCDDCEAAINPVFARQLAERKAWKSDNARGR
jgi:hypothetical protein